MTNEPRRETAQGQPSVVRLPVWDLPVRLCHWSFAILLPLMWLTAEYGAFAWHKRLGMVLFALVVFRIVWGFVGGSTARFGSYLRGPRIVWNYLRDVATPRAERHVGHNPAGGWSALALLAAMLLQSGMGLFAGDPFDGRTGPLNHLASVGWADKVTDWHGDFFWILVSLVGLHLAAIAFYLVVRNDNLTAPMLTGMTRLPASHAGLRPAARGTAAICALTAIAFAVWIWLEAPPL